MSMPRQEVLERTKMAEQETSNIAEEAEAEHEELVAEACEEADEIRLEAEKEAAKFESERPQKGRADMETERKHILEEDEDTRDGPVAEVEDHIDDTVELTIGKFEEVVDAQT